MICCSQLLNLQTFKNLFPVRPRINNLLQEPDEKSLSCIIKFKTPSVAEQPETSQPASEQRRRLFGHSQRRRNSSRGGGGRLFGRCFLVRDGCAVVQVGVDEALAASDVVDAADRRVSSVRQRETWLLLCDGADSLVTQISVQNVLPCSGDETATKT